MGDVERIFDKRDGKEENMTIKRREVEIEAGRESMKQEEQKEEEEEVKEHAHIEKTKEGAPSCHYQDGHHLR